MHIRQSEVVSRQRTNPRISVFARKLLTEWNRLRLPVEEQNVVVAVSGGADSTALLLALDELLKAGRLPLKLIVAHLNHGLRGEQSALDALWVNEIAVRLGHDIALEQIDVHDLAIKNEDNLEQSARLARYQFLLDVAGREKSAVVLTAHTMDDQAETVLLRLMRGSGVDGLGGINPIRTLDPERQVLLIRPLLRWARRADTENYCRHRDIDFRFDAMNDDESFNRVRVRKHLLPLMKSFNPRIVEVLSRTSAMLQTDLSALQLQAEELLQKAGDKDENGATTLRIDVLSVANISVRRRALRRWITQARGSATRLEHVHLLAVDKLVFGEQGGRVAELPGGSFVKRTRGKLQFYAGDYKHTED